MVNQKKPQNRIIIKDIKVFKEAIKEAETYDLTIALTLMCDGAQPATKQLTDDIT